MTAQPSVVVTGASGGFGSVTVRALAEAGHTPAGRVTNPSGQHTWTGMRTTAGRNAPAFAPLAEFKD
ncbi:hypothetical protein [Streptomyces sp. bgisy159]|uniref:hypothetical protein n=1 Tax=Streptomyces sp. bgisy159 TaxID=3413795 RepID=UPI003F49BD54